MNTQKVYYNDGEFIEKVDFKGNILDVDDYLNSSGHHLCMVDESTKKIFVYRRPEKPTYKEEVKKAEREIHKILVELSENRSA